MSDGVGCWFSAYSVVIVLFPFRGEKDERNQRQIGVPLQRLQNPVAVQFGHHDIAQDQVRIFPSRQLDAFAPVFSFDRLILMIAEQRDDVPPHLRFIFNYEYFFHDSFQKPEA